MASRKKTGQKSDAELHKNHRKRVFSRYDKTGFDSFPEHNILELLLFFSIPRADTNPIAHRLIDSFGSLYGVLTAPLSKLTQVQGVGPASARMLHTVMDTGRSAIIRKIAQAPIVSYEALYMLCVQWLSGKPSGTVALLLLDKDKRYIDAADIALEHRILPPSFPEDVLSRAKKANASYAVLMHNHKDGELYPSNEDLQITLRTYNLLALADIRLAEHLIVYELDAIPILDESIGLKVSAYPHI